MHVLDTSQGIIVKKIFEKEEYILYRSEESELYPDFMIHKSEIHNHRISHRIGKKVLKHVLLCTIIKIGHIC